MKNKFLPVVIGILFLAAGYYTLKIGYESYMTKKLLALQYASEVFTEDKDFEIVERPLPIFKAGPTLNMKEVCNDPEMTFFSEEQPGKERKNSCKIIFRGQNLFFFWQNNDIVENLKSLLDPEFISKEFEKGGIEQDDDPTAQDYRALPSDQKALFFKKFENSTFIEKYEDVMTADCSQRYKKISHKTLEQLIICSLKALMNGDKYKGSQAVKYNLNHGIAYADRIGENQKKNSIIFILKSEKMVSCSAPAIDLCLEYVHNILKFKK